MNPDPRTGRIAGFAVILVAGAILLLPGLLQARDHHDRRKGGLPEVLAYLQDLRDEVGALRAEVSGISSRLDALEGAPLAAETRYCFESETAVGVAGALRVGTGYGLNTTRGTDAYGNAALANHETTAARDIEARQGATTRGRFVVCISGGATPLGRPLTADEAGLVESMNDAANDVRSHLNLIVDALNTDPARLGPGLDLLAEDALGFDDPTGAIGEQQFADIGPALAGSSAVQSYFQSPNELISDSAAVGDVCAWAGSVGGSLEAVLSLGISSRCADPGGMDMADSLQALNDSVLAIQGVTNATYSFSTNTMYPVLSSVHSVVGSIDGEVDSICSAVPGC